MTTAAAARSMTADRRATESNQELRSNARIAQQLSLSATLETSPLL
jgi:hypothetical protein